MELFQILKNKETVRILGEDHVISMDSEDDDRFAADLDDTINDGNLDEILDRKERKMTAKFAP